MVPPPRRPEAGGAGQARQAEVGHLHLALARDEDVVGLDVQMEHLVAVGRLQRVRDRREHGRHHVGVDVVIRLAQHVAQAHAVHVLHDEVGHAVVHREIVHAHNGGVGKQGRGLRLLEPRHLRRSGIKARGGLLVELDAFDGDTALDDRVPRQLHGGEAARARFGDKPITIEYQPVFHGLPLPAMRRGVFGLSLTPRTLCRARRGVSVRTMITDGQPGRVLIKASLFDSRMVSSGAPFRRSARL